MLALVVVPLTLVLVEVGVRLTYVSRWLHGPPDLDVSLTTDPSAMPGVSGTARTLLDGRGMRSHGLARGAGPRVLCLGGSTTECAALDHSEAWPGLVQRALGAGAWVGAAARSGATTHAHRMQLDVWAEELEDLDVVLCLTGVNDLALALQGGAPHPERAFFARAQQAAWWPPQRTRTWELLDRTRRSRWARASAQRDLPGRLETWRALHAAAQPHRDDLPDLAPALASYAQLLRAMAARARRSGVELVFATQPVRWSAGVADDGLCWFGWIGRAPAAGTPDGYYSISALAEGMQRFNDRLRAVCAEEGVALVDLAAELSGDPRWFYDDCHLNEAGAREVAARFSAALR